MHLDCTASHWPWCHAMAGHDEMDHACTPLAHLQIGFNANSFLAPLPRPFPSPTPGYAQGWHRGGNGQCVLAGGDDEKWFMTRSTVPEFIVCASSNNLCSSTSIPTPNLGCFPFSREMSWFCWEESGIVTGEGGGVSSYGLSSAHGQTQSPGSPLSSFMLSLKHEAGLCPRVSNVLFCPTRQGWPNRGYPDCDGVPGLEYLGCSALPELVWMCYHSTSHSLIKGRLRWIE